MFWPFTAVMSKKNLLDLLHHLCRIFDCFKRAALLFFVMMVALIGNAPVHAFETFTAHGGPVKGLALSPNGEWMVSASFDYSAVMWSVPSYEEKLTLLGHDAALNVARFSPDGRWLATGGDDYQILLWDVARLLIEGDQVEPVIIKAHLGKVVGLNFSKDSQYLVSSSWDGSARIWDVEKIHDIVGAGGAVEDTLIMALEGHDGPVNVSQFSDDGQYLYTAGYDGFIHYWRLQDQMLLRSVIKNGWGVNVMHVDEAMGVLAYGSTDGAMVIHDLQKDQELLRMGDDRVPVLSITVSPNGAQIGFGNSKGIVKIVDMASMSLLRNFKAANGPVWTLLLMQEEGDMVIGSLDDHITKWQITEFPPHILITPGPDRRFHPTEGLSNGERQFARKCSICHTLKPDGKRRAGPSLYQVFGRKAGTLEGYPYSDALLKSSIIWSRETIAQLFTDGPDVVTPGTKMPIQRMKNQQDRDDLINYLEENTQ